MNINDIIRQLQALPKSVRDRPLMDGEPTSDYWLAPVVRIAVDKVIVMADGSVRMADPELSDGENIAEVSDYDRPAHVEKRALAFVD